MAQKFTVNGTEIEQGSDHPALRGLFVDIDAIGVDLEGAYDFEIKEVKCSMVKLKQRDIDRDTDFFMIVDWNAQRIIFISGKALKDNWTNPASKERTYRIESFYRPSLRTKVRASWITNELPLHELYANDWKGWDRVPEVKEVKKWVDRMRNFPR